MADYDIIEIVTKRTIFRVKGPAPLGEVGKAIQAARMACAQAKGVPVDKLFDDAVMVAAYDQDIHVFFEEEVKQ
jgi:hypothetical protein